MDVGVMTDEVWTDDKEHGPRDRPQSASAAPYVTEGGTSIGLHSSVLPRRLVESPIPRGKHIPTHACPCSHTHLNIFILVPHTSTHTHTHTHTHAHTQTQCYTNALIH